MHEHPDLMIITDAGSQPIDTLDTPVPSVPTTENLPISPMKSFVFYQDHDIL